MTTATKVNPVEAFLNKVREDGQLRAQIECLTNQEKKPAIAEIVRIANKLNYKFNAKQYEAFARTECCRSGMTTAEPTDQDLIRVACGCC